MYIALRTLPHINRYVSYNCRYIPPTSHCARYVGSRACENIIIISRIIRDPFNFRETRDMQDFISSNIFCLVYRHYRPWHGQVAKQSGNRNIRLKICFPIREYFDIQQNRTILLFQNKPENKRSKDHGLPTSQSSYYPNPLSLKTREHTTPRTNPFPASPIA